MGCLLASPSDAGQFHLLMWPPVTAGLFLHGPVLQWLPLAHGWLSSPLEILHRQDRCLFELSSRNGHACKQRCCGCGWLLQLQLCWPAAGWAVVMLNEQSAALCSDTPGGTGVQAVQEGVGCQALAVYYR